MGNGRTLPEGDQGLITTTLVKGSMPSACVADTGAVSLTACITRTCTLRYEVEILCLQLA